MPAVQIKSKTVPRRLLHLRTVLVSVSLLPGRSECQALVLVPPWIHLSAPNMRLRQCHRLCPTSCPRRYHQWDTCAVIRAFLMTRRVAALVPPRVLLVCVRMVRHLPPLFVWPVLVQSPVQQVIRIQSVRSRLRQCPQRAYHPTLQAKAKVDLHNVSTARWSRCELT